uniref:Uncharacterized protein n=1 Tax=Anguilla anguilla TaxID=7936 RepID=A0A0E9S2A4_ANGAN
MECSILTGSSIVCPNKKHTTPPLDPVHHQANENQSVSFVNRKVMDL